MISKEKLDFWISNGLNVLFVGKHGVGKTTIVTEAFDRAGLKWLYYSASTMDPWVDMIGVPKERKAEDGSSYLDLVRPKEFQNDEVEALFFDEFNRSHKKIRNAVMELIQFRSINGKKFKNLKLVWAAINPEDEDEYDVEKLDPAQEDRFHIKVDVPYKPHLPYFNSKYGKGNAKAAVSWWGELPVAQKGTVSPRRLDYALDVHTRNGDIRDVLPHGTNVAKLITFLKSGPIKEALQKFVDSNDIEGARTFLQQENNFAAARDHLIKKDVWIPFFVPLLANEKLVLLMTKDDKIVKHVVGKMEKIPHYKKVVEDVVAAKQSKKLIRKINKELRASGKYVGTPGGGKLGTKAVTPWYACESFSALPTELEDARHRLKKRGQNTYHRREVWREVSACIPRQLSAGNAVLLLGVIDKIVWHSQIFTLSKMKNIYGALNHAIKTIADSTGTNWNDICRNYKNEMRGILWKIARNSKFAEKIYIPK
jgi:hypothetical protein